MIALENSWALFLLPLPLLVHYFWPSFSSELPSLRVPFFDSVVMLDKQNTMRQGLVLKRRWWQKILMVLVWFLILLAAAKPVWLSEPIEIKEPARDLMVAVDLSGSMAELDFAALGEEPISRLSGAKQVLAEFAQNREGDRLGLIVFGDAPFLQLPFSKDRELFVSLLQQSQVRMAGPKTMLGDAIGFTYKHFLAEAAASENEDEHEIKENTSKSKRGRVLILLSDGNDSGSKVPPVEAAQLAAKEQITIYPIVLGDSEAVAEQAIDEAVLKKIAEVTGGKFFRASNRDDLGRISEVLAELEPNRFSVRFYRPRQELFFWPLLLSIVIAFSAHLIMGTRSFLKLRRSM